jgi:hypothetical protein
MRRRWRSLSFFELADGDSSEFAGGNWKTVELERVYWIGGILLGGVGVGAAVALATKQQQQAATVSQLPPVYKGPIWPTPIITPPTGQIQQPPVQTPFPVPVPNPRKIPPPQPGTPQPPAGTQTANPSSGPALGIRPGQGVYTPPTGIQQGPGGSVNTGGISNPGSTQPTIPAPIQVVLDPNTGVSSDVQAVPGQQVSYTTPVGGIWAWNTGFQVVYVEDADKIGLAKIVSAPAPHSLGSNPLVFTYVGPGLYRATLFWIDAFDVMHQNYASIVARWMTFGAHAASQDGWSVTVRPYADGEAGLRQSLEEVARLMRLAKDDSLIKQWAVHVLAAKGVDGRDRPSIRLQAQTLLDAFRAQTIYVPDSAGAEHIQAAHITLCLKDRCIPGEDCESLCLALGGAMLSIGLPVYAVKVDYGPDHQQHLVLGLIDENGNKLYADPSTKKPIQDHMVGAVDLLWVDPLDQIGTLGSVGAEIVTLGAPQDAVNRVFDSVARDVEYRNGHWTEYRYGRWWVHASGRWNEMPSGFGRPAHRDGYWWLEKDNVEVRLTEQQAEAMGLGQVTVQPAAVTTQTPYQQVTDSQVHAGLRYRLGIQLTFTVDPSTLTQAAILAPLASDWYVESFDAQTTANFIAGLNQWEQAYILQGISLRDHQLVNDAYVNYLVVGVQATSVTSAPQASAIVPAPTSNRNVSLVAASAIAAVAGGVGYALWKKGVFRG